MRVIFLDTNLFLQCRDLKELPWKEIADEDELLLLIPKTVENEIDRQKAEGNTRRGKRARKTSAFFREIVLSDNPSFVINENNPRVEVSFPDISPTETITVEALDLTRPDDRIISEICNYKTINPNDIVLLLTNDSYPMRMCKKLNIAFQVIPESWLLPPETDERDKKITELEKKLAKIEKSNPVIELQSYDINDVALSSTALVVTDYCELSEKEIDKLVTEARKRRPMKNNFDEEESPKSPLLSATARMNLQVFGYDKHYVKPSEKQIDTYKNEIYPKWLTNVESFYKSLHSKLGFEERHFTIIFKLTNNGTVPAENLVIEFNTFGGILITSTERKEQLFEKIKIELPIAPKAPQGEWVQRKIGFGHLDHLNKYATARVDNLIKAIQPNLNRDRNSFYWKNGNSESYSHENAFECQEFRHQVEAETFELVVFIPFSKKITKGGLTCLVTAKNIPTPIKSVFPITINYNSVDTAIFAGDLLNKALPEIKLMGV